MLERPRYTRLRIGFVVLLIALLGVVVTPSAGVVEAQATPCADALIDLPSNLFSFSGSSGVTLGFQGPVVPPSSPIVLSTGSALLTAASYYAGGTAAVAGTQLLGAALVGGMIGCSFVDILNADKLAIDAACSLGSWWTGMVGASGGCDAPAEAALGSSSATFTPVTVDVQAVRSVDIASEMPGTAGYQLQIAGRGRALTGGAVSIQDKGIPPQYVRPDYLQASTGEVLFPYVAGHLANAGTTSGTNMGGSSCPLYSFSTSTSCDDVFGWRGGQPTPVTRLTVRYACSYPTDHDLNSSTADVAFLNPGGVCGVVPGTVLLTMHESDTTKLFGLVLPYSPEANANGWQRRYVTDNYCVSGGAGVWRRFEGVPFYDKGTTTSRPNGGVCNVGEIPAQTVITKVPVNVECAMGVVCWPNSQVAAVTLPPTWLDPVTAPPFVEPCLTVGSACPAPAVVGDECHWPASVVVEMTYCTAPLVETAGVEDVTPTATEVVDVSATPLGEPTTTGTVTTTDTPTVPPDDDGGDIIVNVDVPIDDDGEESARVICPSIEVTEVGGIPCIPASEGGDCLDDWGWFNPVTWVLVPIKCAFMWAFVPDDVDGWATEQWASLETEIPFSYGVAVVGFFDDLTDPAGAASAEPPCWVLEAPVFDEGGANETAAVDMEACLEFADQAQAADDTPFLAVLLQWCMVGWMVYKFMMSTIGAIL